MIAEYHFFRKIAMKIVNESGIMMKKVLERSKRFLFFQTYPFNILLAFEYSERKL